MLDPTRRTITMGDARFHVLPPPPGETYSLNDRSLGLRVDFGEASVFLGGDAESAEWAYWLRTMPELLGPVTVHKASHHGSVNGDTEAGIASLSPRVVVVSAGRENPHGHPHAAQVRLYREAGARVLTTAEEGEIRIRLHQDGRVYLEGEGWVR